MESRSTFSTRFSMVITRARISMTCHIFILAFLTWIIKYKHISDSCEHENTVFVGHINAYLNHILALGHIWAQSDIKSYFGHILGEFHLLLRNIFASIGNDVIWNFLS